MPQIFDISRCHVHRRAISLRPLARNDDGGDGFSTLPPVMTSRETAADLPVDGERNVVSSEFFNRADLIQKNRPLLAGKHAVAAIFRYPLSRGSPVFACAQ